MDVVVFFSPSTKSRHRARGHQNHHQHDEKEVNVNPADINDADFYDFVQSSQQMMMEEIGKQKRQQQLRSNRSEKQAAKSRQKAVASISQEEYEIRLLKARLAELEQASRG
ncbi:unnamed protein product [Bathycoccus prasinos]